MRKVLFIMAAVALLVGATVFFNFTAKEEKSEFRTEKVRRGNLIQTVTASGTVNPVNTVLVGTQVSGTISHIYADFNSAVKKGRLIAEIDPSIFHAKLEQAKANLLQARAGLQKAEAEHLNAKRDMDRKRSLFSKEIVPKSELDESETDYALAKAQVTIAKAQIAQAEAALKQDETNLKYTRILSPVDGIVISRDVNVGQTVAASFQTPTLFTIAEDLTKMQIEASVNEADIGTVKAGQDVEFAVDAHADITFKGGVSQVRIAPTTLENVVTYDVVIMVENPEFKLKPGMTATVSIIVSDRKGVLMVPNAALRFSYPPGGLAMYDVQGIWIPGDGKPERIEITTGITDGNHTEIISGEIKEGQEIIVESKGKSKDGPNARHRWRFL
jgi:HlyD family secretion protein